MKTRGEYDAEVASALKAARVVRGYALISFAFGWIVTIGALIAWAVGWVTFSDAADLLLVIGLGTVLGAVALFGSSWSLQLAARRLAIEVATKLPTSAGDPAAP